MLIWVKINLPEGNVSTTLGEKMNKNTTILMAVMLGIAGCGGGGGTSTPVATPAPTVTLTLSQSKITLGSSSTIAWSSTDATSCAASGAWSGTQAISGSSAQTPTTSGANTYTLTCTGTGGTTNQTAILTVPIPVLKSSYENKAAAGEAIGPQTLPSEVSSNISINGQTFLASNSVAFADFFQNGSYSMVTASISYNVNDPSTFNNHGKIHFWKNVNGTWIDSTSNLLSDNTGCIHPRKAIVADFNGDGIPDVFFSCTGPDVFPIIGEHPYMVLSQPDGTYKTKVLDNTCYCHGASAADFDGNGFASIIATGNTDKQNPNVPFFIINQKNGTFATDFTRLPVGVPGLPYPNLVNVIGPGAIYTAELIDFSNTGKYDAFLAGGEPDNVYGNWLPTIFKNDGTNHYSMKTILPSDSKFPQTNDIVFLNGFIYLNRVQLTYNSSIYGFSGIQKINYSTLQTTDVYSNSVNFVNGESWVNWIIPYKGNITSLDSAFGVSAPQ